MRLIVLLAGSSAALESYFRRFIRTKWMIPDLFEGDEGDSQLRCYSENFEPWKLIQPNVNLAVMRVAESDPKTLSTSARVAEELVYKLVCPSGFDFDKNRTFQERQVFDGFCQHQCALKCSNFGSIGELGNCLEAQGMKSCAFSLQVIRPLIAKAACRHILREHVLSAKLPTRGASEPELLGISTYYLIELDSNTINFLGSNHKRIEHARVVLPLAGPYNLLALPVSDLGNFVASVDLPDVCADVNSSLLPFSITDLGEVDEVDNRDVIGVPFYYDTRRSAGTGLTYSVTDVTPMLKLPSTSVYGGMARQLAVWWPGIQPALSSTANVTLELLVNYPADHVLVPHRIVTRDKLPKVQK